MPIVSVIIPNYNHERFLKQRIDSVLNQTYQDFELIILDDCSSDNSKTVIESYGNHPEISHIVYNEFNGGNPFKQWQKGIKLAKGDFIWIAESDDWAEKNFLETVVSAMEANNDLGIVFTDSNWVNDKGVIGKSLSLYKDSFIKKGAQEIKEKLLYYNTIQNASACLFRKNSIENLFKDLNQFKACGDWLLYIRILQKSNLQYIAQQLNNFRWYHQNTSNNAVASGLTYQESLALIYKVDFAKTHLTFKEKINFIRNWYFKTKKIGYLHAFKNTIKIIRKLTYG